MTQKASNLLGQTVQTLENGNFQIGSNLLTPGLNDAQGASNWVLVDKKTFTNGIVDYTIPCDSTVDDKFMINVKRTTVTATKPLYLQLGNISTGYKRVTASGGLSNNVNYVGGGQGNELGFVISKSSIASSSSEICIKNGQWRISHSKNLQYKDDLNRWTNIDSTCLQDTTTTFNSMRIFSDNESTSCEIEIYKWQETKSVELHSLELVKEIKFTSSVLDVTIPWDGELDSDIVVIGTLVGSGIGIQLNGDIGNNYLRAYHWAGGNSEHTGAQNYLNYIPLLNEGYNEFSGNFKKGSMRCFMANSCMSSSGKTYSYQTSTKWTNTVDGISSIKFFCIGDTAQTGSFRIYKRVKTHLVCQTPGLLQGMWQKSIDANTVEIQPGSIEIKGIVHNQGSKKQITLSGNLRTGETEAANTYYYLYAVSSIGRTISYKFSSIAPTMDRFGNLVSSFEECDPNQSWHHRNEGITWRWIGQVYNNSFSDILGFDKCSTKYWEGKWTSINWTSNSRNTISHGYGKIPINREIAYSETGTGAPINTNHSYHEGFGINLTNPTPFTNSVFYIGTGVTNYWANSAGVWVTTGYYKAIIKE